MSAVLSTNNTLDLDDRKHQAREKENEETYEMIIMWFHHAVHLQTDLEVATATLDRWKAYQLSAQYAGSGPAASKILDNQRLRYAQSMTHIRENLAIALDKLSTLPNLAERVGALSDEVDETGLMRYNSEMQLWIRSLEALHLELSVPVPAPVVYGNLVTASDKPDDPKTWTWSQIQASLIHLDGLLATIVEKFYLERYTLNTDFDGPLTNIRHKETSRMSRDKADQVGDQLEEASNRTAAHPAVIAQNDAKLQQLRDELAKLEGIQRQMKDFMTTFEQWREEDQAKIQDLSTRLRELRARPKLPPPPHSSENMREILRSVLSKHVDEIGSQLIAILCAACATNNDDFMRAVTKKLQPTRELTIKLHERAGRTGEDLVV